MINNEIVLSAAKMGVWREGFVSGTPKPGTCMQILAATAPISGRLTYKAANPGADGGRQPIMVLVNDWWQGMPVTQAYVAGTRCFMYCPAMGEELNMLYLDVSGTHDSHAIQDVMIVQDATGLLIPTTGSPTSQPFQCIETIAVNTETGNTLVGSMFTGY